MSPVSDFFHIVHSQRACRAFTSEPVPDEVVAQLLEIATRAPSAENLQPWAFVVCEDPDARSGLAEIAAGVWAAARELVVDRLDPIILRDTDRLIDKGFGGAPVIVVVCADTNLVEPPFVEGSIFPAVQNLLLGASALGYGSALTTFTLFDLDAVRKLLVLPDHIRPLAVVPIGRPARSLTAPRRRPAGPVTYRDRFGVPFRTDGPAA